MLISRTNREYQNYWWMFSSTFIKGAIDNQCPNDISSLSCDIVTDISLTSNGCIPCTVQEGISNTYIKLYLNESSTDINTYDSQIFYGENLNIDLETYNLTKILINGDTYYFQIYEGNTYSGCCSNLTGKTIETGSFIQQGFIPIKLEGNTILYTGIYSLS